jgi:hypothetical protein
MVMKQSCKLALEQVPRDLRRALPMLPPRLVP